MPSHDTWQKSAPEVHFTLHNFSSLEWCCGCRQCYSSLPRVKLLKSLGSWVLGVGLALRARTTTGARVLEEWLRLSDEGLGSMGPWLNESMTLQTPRQKWRARRCISFYRLRAVVIGRSCFDLPRLSIPGHCQCHS